MTALLFDGFDHADVNHRWTGGFTSELSTSVVRTGSRSYLNNSAGAKPYYMFDPDEDDTIYVGFGFYSPLGDDIAILNLSEGNNLGSGHVGLIRKGASRGWEVRRGTNWANPATGTLLIPSIPNVWFPDSWHYIEFGAKIADSGGWVELRQDGITIGRFDGDTRDTVTVDGLIDTVFFNRGFIGTNGSYYIDDVYILNEQGSINNSWLGDTRVFPLYPEDNGSYSELVGSDADSTDNYLLVDEAGTPNTSDYVGSSTDGDQDSYEFQDLPVTVGTIRGVEVRMVAAKDDTGTKQMRSLTRRAGADVFGADKTLAAIPLWQTHTEIQEEDPHAGPGAWTIPNVNATEWGVEVRP